MIEVQNLSFSYPGPQARCSTGSSLSSNRAIPMASWGATERARVPYSTSPRDYSARRRAISISTAWNRPNARLGGASELEASLTGVETIKADLSGASEADLKFNNCGTALLSASGASNVDLSGTIRSLTKNVGTGSNVKEEKLTIGR